MTIITYAEALLIAEKIMEKEGWTELLPKLRKAAQNVDYLGITKVNYFDKNYPCVFLDKDNLCTIYESRPACCRYHIVCNPPENCSNKAPRTAKTLALDLIEAEQAVWNLSFMVVQQLSLEPLIAGPIPIMVLACMRNIVEDKNEYKLIVEACEGLRSPFEWMRDCSVTAGPKDGDFEIYGLDQVGSEIK